MDAKENSKEEQQYTSPYLISHPSISLITPNLYPMFSTMEFNVLNNARANTNRGNSNFFVPCKGYSQHSFENYSDSDSSSGDASDDEEACLDELYDGKAKEKIEQLAAMVGVDTKDPAVVLTEVVRVLKQLKRINQ